MGRTYHFECPYCHYRADLSGGTDGGVHCEVQTVTCRSCRELYDVFAKVRRVEGAEAGRVKFPSFARPEIPPVILRDTSGKRRLIWQKCKLVCPVDSRHEVESWNEPGRCPRCGNFMEKEGLPFRAWD